MKSNVKASSSQTLAVHRDVLPPGLYIVPTPIGNLRDITVRALSVLQSASVVACEDTRVTGKLLRHYGIATPMDPYHEHNAAKKRPALLARIHKGEAVALVSDAGTPLISDPGYKLVREAAENGLHVEALPGASSVLTALCVAALPTDRFCFCGFLPTKAGAARAELEALKAVPATLVFFESAKRVAHTLQWMHEVLGNREAAVCRELTKLHEEARRAPLAELAEHYAKAPEPRGEIVLVIGPPLAEKNKQIDDARLAALLARMSLKDAVAAYVAESGEQKSKVYARALLLRE